MGIKNITDNLKDTVFAGHSALLASINAGVISLLWDIGKEINNHEPHMGRIDNGISFVEDLSGSLIPLLGKNMNSQNLSAMMKFAKRCQLSTIEQIAAAINWDYIPYFLDLEEKSAWIFYMKLMHIHSLDPEGLNKKIIAGTFEKERNIDENAYMRSRSKPFYQNTDELYFGKAREAEFRRLFEPPIDNEAIILAAQAKNPYSKIVKDIFGKVLEFQTETHSMLNAQFNNLLWEIGVEIIRLSKVSNVAVTKITDTCIQDLGKFLPSVFNKAELTYCVRFAEKYRNPDDHEEIAEIISWPYLKIILDVADKDKQLMIARQVFNNGISIEELKGMLSDGCFDFMDTSSRLPLKNKVTDRSVTTEKMDENNQITITQELVEPIINPDNDLNRNIYKNPELLALLTNNIYKD